MSIDGARLRVMIFEVIEGESKKKRGLSAQQR
jgi:hypothetical protein